MYQFVHVESYSRSTPKRASSINKKTGKVSSAKSSGHCVSYIVNEAIREVNSIPHVKNPLPPEYLFGEPLEALETTCNEWASSLKDARGHAMRKDALCLAAGIVSAPKDITPEAWDAFQRDSVQWLKDKYGPALRTVIAHHDESHPHLHFYAVPEPGQRFESIHQGRQAAAQVKAEGGLKGLQNQAYKAAMRGFQDEFYERVGIEHGFTRIGPAKRRLTREEWKLEQIQAAAAARAIEVAKASVAASAEQSATLIADAKAEAIVVAATALKNADAIALEAEKTGFKSGFQAALDAFEQVPWFKRLLTALGRDSEQRAASARKIERLEGQKTRMRDRITELFDAGKAHRDELNDVVKPQLAAVRTENALLRTKAEDVERLHVQNEALKGRVQHLEAVNEALQPTPEAEPEALPKKRRTAQDLEVEVGQ